MEPHRGIAAYTRGFGARREFTVDGRSRPREPWGNRRSGGSRRVRSPRDATGRRPGEMVQQNNQPDYESRRIGIHAADEYRLCPGRMEKQKPYRR